jgi:uncharacterized protein (DUF1778 family)
MPQITKRRDRINLQLSPQAKRRLERAAVYSETTLNNFIVDAALQRANAILEKQDTITLTGEEWERFHALLLHPPEPNDRFRRAAAEHKRIVGKDGEAR